MHILIDFYSEYEYSVYCSVLVSVKCNHYIIIFLSWRANTKKWRYYYMTSRIRKLWNAVTASLSCDSIFSITFMWIYRVVQNSSLVCLVTYLLESLCLSTVPWSLGIRWNEWPHCVWGESASYPLLFIYWLDFQIVVPRTSYHQPFYLRFGGNCFRTFLA